MAWDHQRHHVAPYERGHVVPHERGHVVPHERHRHVVPHAPIHRHRPPVVVVLPSSWYDQTINSAPIVFPAPPTVFIENNDPPSTPSGYWYRCDDPPGYYPEVKECLAGWTQVAPTPPDF